MHRGDVVILLLSMYSSSFSPEQYCTRIPPSSSSQDPTDRSIKTHKRRLLTIAHEFAHILGMSSYDFPYYYSHATGLPRTPRDEWGRPPEVESLCVDGTRRVVPVASESTLRSATTPNGYVAYEIVTETVRNVVRNQFDCRRVDGARLEVGFSSMLFVFFDSDPSVH